MAASASILMLMWGQGILVGQDSRVEWQVESAHVEAHPIQQAAPEGRKKLDTFYDVPESE